MLITLAGCVSTPPRAPVIDRSTGAVAVPTSPAKKTKEPDWRPPAYTVQKGDTLYSIALEHGHDYKDIAVWNNIQAPYTIRIGQVLRLASAQAEGTTPLKTVPTLEAKPLAPGEVVRKNAYPHHAAPASLRTTVTTMPRSSHARFVASGIRSSVIKW